MGSNANLFLMCDYSIVVERAIELGFISSVIDALATAYSFFIEGSISPEVRWRSIVQIMCQSANSPCVLVDRNCFRNRRCYRYRLPILPPHTINVSPVCIEQKETKP